MINQEGFNFLPENEKLSYLRSRGQFLASRRTHVFEIKLYGLHYFYVEVYFRPNHYKCDYIDTFRGTLLLDPYLAEIKINMNLQ